MKRPLYWIYDYEISRSLDADGAILLAILKEGAVDLIQLRAKNLSMKEVEAWAAPLVKKIEEYGIPCILNDFPDLAHKLGCMGVHVGQSDTSVAEIRAKYGDSLVIGATARSMSEAHRAVDEGADHLGVGTMFETTTKPGLIPRGITYLEELLTEFTLPLYPIGGIDRDNVHLIKEAGGEGIALSSAIFRAENPVRECQIFRNVFNG